MFNKVTRNFIRGLNGNERKDNKIIKLKNKIKCITKK